MTDRTADRAKSANKDWLRALEATAQITQQPHRTLPVVIGELAAEFGDAPALLSERQQLTYRQLGARVNQYARWAMAQGIRAGDVVCLLMPDRPEYVATWLGLTRVGAVVALVNTNVSGEALAHAVTVAQPIGIIVSGAYLDRLADALPLVRSPPRCWVHGPAAIGSLHVNPDEYPDAPLEDAECPPPALSDRALCIYTSGTTGLPKAANVSHYRIMQWCYWFAGLLDARPSDRMYNCLPLQHSIGGVVAVGAVLVRGGSVVLPGRFSASRFWDDVVRWECTLFQYIGELCRYLLNSPAHPKEAQHKLRLCTGNGLAAEVWEPFRQRFRIPRILEFYAATEGSFSLYNVEGEPGSIGRIPGFLAHRFPVALVKFDIDREAPQRGPDGLCIRCATNETGEAVGKLGHVAGRFEGYTDSEASDRKLLRSVFEPGDAWFRTGDLMRRDDRGFFYFMDRIGDTFRWKGENVSTTEVAAVLSACVGVREAVVYGVRMPRAEGRAGMAAVTTGPQFDIARLHRHVTERLPDYARPLFLRVRPEIEATATFKPKKQELMRQGYDLREVTEPLYFYDRQSLSYVSLDPPLFARIESGEVRL